MFDYIKAEIYRTRKTSNNKIMWVLGVAAILITITSIMSLPGDHTKDSFYFGMTQMMGATSVFMSILIMGAGFKEGFEEKNYVQKGYSRSNIVVGDLIVASISTIIKAIVFLGLIFLTSHLLKDGGEDAITFGEFSVYVFFVVMMVLTMNCGTYAIYNINYKSGVASTLSFFYYLLLPQISRLFIHYDNLFGTISKFIMNTAPLKLYGELGAFYVDGIEFTDSKNLVIMLIINLGVFNLISLVAKNRKRY